MPVREPGRAIWCSRRWTVLPAAEQVQGIPRSAYGFQHVTGGVAVLVKPFQRGQRGTDTQPCLASNQGNPARAPSGALQEIGGQQARQHDVAWCPHVGPDRVQERGRQSKDGSGVGVLGGGQR